MFSKKRTTPMPISDLVVLQLKGELEHFKPTQGTMDPLGELVLCPCNSCANVCGMPPMLAPNDVERHVISNTVSPNHLVRIFI